MQLHKTAPDRAAASATPLRSRNLGGGRGQDPRRPGRWPTAYRGAADRILYDAKTPDGAALPGGMGLRFDWRLLDGLRASAALGAVGRADAANVAEAVRVTGATLVDVSSGVESAPGVKDVDKIAAFLRAVSL